jgi:hypothetical protein
MPDWPSTAAAIGDPLAATQARAQALKAVLKQAELPNDLTRKLARFIISARLADMPEAKRIGFSTATSSANVRRLTMNAKRPSAREAR